MRSSNPSAFILLVPPPCPNTGQVLVQGAKVRKHGVAVFGQARVAARHIPWSTYADESQPYPSKHDNTKQQASIHPRTQERMELQLHQHFDTHIDPCCSLPKATNHNLYWDRKNDGSKKHPKVQKHGVAVIGQARVRTWGRGVWHEALVVGSVSLWRRLLASRL